MTPDLDQSQVFIRHSRTREPAGERVACCLSPARVPTPLEAGFSFRFHHGSRITQCLPVFPRKRDLALDYIKLSGQSNETFRP